MKTIQWLLLLPCAVGAVVFRRWMLFSFDEAGLPLPLSARTLALPALLCAAALVYALSARRLPAQRTLCAEMGSYFRFSPLTLTAVVGACFLLVLGEGFSLVRGEMTTAALVSAGLMAAGALCLLAAAAAMRKGKEFSGLLLLVPVCALVLRLIFFYREHTADPVLRDYYIELLALAAMTLFLLEFAAFAFRGGAPRLFVPLGFVTALLCAAATAAAIVPSSGFSLGELAFYAASTVLSLGLLGAADFEP